MRVVAGAVLFLLSFLGSAFAQIPKANIFVGYSYMSADLPNISGRQNLNGWEGSLEGKVLPLLGIVADGSGNYGKTQIPICSLHPGGSCANVHGISYPALLGTRASAYLA